MAESVTAAAWMLAMLAAFSLARCIDDKCAACNAVAVRSVAQPGGEDFTEIVS